MSENKWKEKWEDLGEIGRGGQGVVNKVKEKTEPFRLGVLKSILPRWENNKQARARLFKESEILSKLHDLGAAVPNVYLEPNTEQINPYLIMEFIPGIRFDKWISSKAPISPSEAIILTRSVAETISICHKNSIGHRDLKPANIILKNSKLSSPYILDFGISFDSRHSIILTNEGDVFWNEFIMLPECQDLGGDNRDLRSDITALAGLFFSCLTGFPPRVLRDAENLAPHERYENQIYKLVKNSEVTQRLLLFFDKAFSNAINDRFQTLEEFTSQLAIFSDSSSQNNLDLDAEFAFLEQATRESDPNVQLALAKQKSKAIIGDLVKRTLKSMNNLSKIGGNPYVNSFRINPVFSINPIENLDGKRIDDAGKVIGISITRQHLTEMVSVVFIPYSEGLKIHLYAGAFISETRTHEVPIEKIHWEKLSTFNENISKISEDKFAILNETIRSRIAFQIRKLSNRKINKNAS